MLSGRKGAVVSIATSFGLFLLAVVLMVGQRAPYCGEQFRSLFPELRRHTLVRIEIDSTPAAVYSRSGPESWDAVWNGERCPVRTHRLNQLLLSLYRVNRQHPVLSDKTIPPVYGLSLGAGTPFRVFSIRGKLLFSGKWGLTHDESRIYIIRDGVPGLYLMDWDPSVSLGPHDLTELRVFPEQDPEGLSGPVPVYLEIATASGQPDGNYRIIRRGEKWLLWPDQDLLDQKATLSMIHALSSLKGNRFYPAIIPAQEKSPRLIIRLGLDNGMTLVAKGWSPAEDGGFLFQREDQSPFLSVSQSELVHALKPLDQILSKPDKN